MANASGLVMIDTSMNTINMPILYQEIDPQPASTEAVITSEGAATQMIDLNSSKRSAKPV